MHANQVIAEVRFGAEVTKSQKNAMKIAVVKASSDTGIVIWLDRNPTEYGRSVIVRKDIGDGNYMSIRGVTVGNLYGYSASYTTTCRAIEEKSEQMDFSDEATRAEACERWENEYHSACKQQEKEFIHRPILEACRRLGVTKLRRHCGDFPREIEGLEIEMITEKETIYVDL